MAEIPELQTVNTIKKEMGKKEENVLKTDSYLSLGL